MIALEQLCNRFIWDEGYRSLLPCQECRSGGVQLFHTYGAATLHFCEEGGVLGICESCLPKHLYRLGDNARSHMFVEHPRSSFFGIPVGQVALDETHTLSYSDWLNYPADGSQNIFPLKCNLSFSSND
jgi:hypothetical protein